MVKRIIAMAAAVLMLLGSTQIPQAHDGEPVRQDVQHDTTEDNSSKSSSGNPVLDENPESADESARRTTDTDRLPDRRVTADIETSKGDEVDEYKGVLSTVSTDICAGSSEGGSEEYGTGTDSAPADGAEPEPERYSEDAAADSWEAAVVPEPEPEPVVEEPAPEPEWTYYGNCRITHYCDCLECTGPWYGSATASGAWPTAFYTVASGDDLPFGTEIMINDQVYVVQDRGVGNGQIDIFVGDHQLALDMGMYFADVYVRW